MTWNQAYTDAGAIWGEAPSELARLAAEHLSQQAAGTPLEVLDIGCGYGRDALYLARRLSAQVTGIDVSLKALEVANRALAESGLSNVVFRERDLRELSIGEGYDVVLVANLFHLLRPEMRGELRAAIRRVLRPGGWLFLNALSVNDPEGYGQGEPVVGDPHSFVADKYRHFATEEELRRTLRFVEIRELYEHAYDEPHEQGRAHHHVSWILIAQRPSAFAEV
ncbi:MAG: class I SAM-dependent methyltransferase [Chloroflexi bacterium]|nr:class I SAM-dependent methyltransferase [Chloroflexota bacterium]